MSEHAVIGPNEEIVVTKIETFVLEKAWVFVKISTDADITGWGEMLKGDAKACAAGALEVANYLVGQDPRRVTHHWQAIHRGAFYRGGPVKTAIQSGIDIALWDITGKCYGVPVDAHAYGPPIDDIVGIQVTVGGTPVEQSAGLIAPAFGGVGGFDGLFFEVDHTDVGGVSQNRKTILEG